MKNIRNVKDYVIWHIQNISHAKVQEVKKYYLKEHRIPS